MSTRPKSSSSNKLLGMLIITGFLLLLTGVPAGLGFGLAFEAHRDSHDDWHWQMLLGAVMGIAAAVMGGIFLCTAKFIVERRRGRQE